MIDTFEERFEHDEIAGSGLTEEAAKWLVSRRHDVDSMTPYDADQHANKIMSGISLELWRMMADTCQRVRRIGYSANEARIHLANLLLASAEDDCFEGDRWLSVGITGKSVYVYEEGSFDTPQNLTPLKG